MPPSGKRSSQRTRKARDPSVPVHTELSSPSRPLKRRRQAQPEPPSEPADDEGSSMTLDPAAGINLEDDDVLISRVAETLTTAEFPVKASEIYANTLQADTEGIEAYAKLAGKDWTYYIRTLAINIGRSSEPSQAHQPPDDPKDKDFVHIDLGPNKVFSRQTAIIFFDDAGSWVLRVKGRNGLKVNGVPLKKDDNPHNLASGEVIEVGGIEMMFALPGTIGGPLNIHEAYLQRAGIKGPVRPQRSSPPSETRHALPSAPSHKRENTNSRPDLDSPSASSSKRSYYKRECSTIEMPQPIAPAPPDYKRPGTPPSAKGRAHASQHKSPAYSNAGTMLMSSNDVDLSLDENKHIKPLFSYAQMITQAISSTNESKLNLNGIYRYIMDNYAYYRHQPPSGWQNSIRHNLSLNKSFNKAPRTTDEPGKGMKWEIVPEQKEEMMRTAWKVGRGGHRGSSAPSSPNQPSQLNYINQGPRDMMSRGPGSARKRKAPSPVIAVSPPPSSSLNPSQMTPDRRYKASGPASFQDGSPLPRSRKPLVTSSFGQAADGLPRSPPTLSSSYLGDDGPSFITPAPHRVHPHLAPPSTAQRPSQHMPTSSPAPFWKYADIGTPLKAVQFDVSPSKPALPNSSSPPPPIEGNGSGDRSPVASPTRSTIRAETQETATIVEEEEEEAGFDLTKYVLLFSFILRVH
ncbi:fork head domain-containing protein [Pseudomassariella vexata]|uniref:Fork head domain-domain-containing protein n=1 Tax=Pseudomassariella vexata TaxID=1141098 RepID=A0A1Y2EE17_9PEZI|nr:fork head domain-containing protein [Pseudomassariella vexata]ORY69821.1 fork head domain-domain-containing protein [Pseudomassariella vexata]